MSTLPPWEQIPSHIQLWLRQFGVTSGGMSVYIPTRSRLSDEVFVRTMKDGYTAGRSKYTILRHIQSRSGWSFDYCRQVERRLRGQINRSQP